MTTTKKQTILVISNEPDGLENLFETLERMGYKLLFAGDAPEGLRLLRGKSPDVVISAMNLPVISGLELCRRIRADKQLHATPLILLSDARSIGINQVEIRLVGADDWIDATADAATLARKIKSVLDQKHMEKDLRQFSQHLRNRHFQVAHMMKGAFSLLTASKFKNQEASPEMVNQQQFEEKLLEEMELGINILGWMSYLLEEHIKAFGDLENDRQKNDFAAVPKAASEIHKTAYECVTYEISDNNFPAGGKNVE